MVERPNKLLDEVCDVARLKHYVNGTEETCVYWAKFFILYRHNRHPLDMREQISQSLTYLPVAENVAASIQNQGLSAARHLC